MNRYILALLMGLVVCHPFLESLYADDKVDGYPTQVKPMQGEYRPSLRLMLSDTIDLRKLFVDPAVIDRRVANATAVFDAGSGHDAWEFKVKPGMTIKDALGQFLSGDWNGGPQIKLIKKNEVYQSIFFAKERTEQENSKFLGLIIEPGDCLVKIPQS